MIRYTRFFKKKLIRINRFLITQKTSVTNYGSLRCTDHINLLHTFQKHRKLPVFSLKKACDNPNRVNAINKTQDLSYSIESRIYSQQMSFAGNNYPSVFF